MLSTVAVGTAEEGGHEGYIVEVGAAVVLAGLGTEVAVVVVVHIEEAVVHIVAVVHVVAVAAAVAAAVAVVVGVRIGVGLQSVEQHIAAAVDTAEHWGCKVVEGPCLGSDCTPVPEEAVVACLGCTLAAVGPYAVVLGWGYMLH